MAVLFGVVDLVAALVIGNLPFGQYARQLFLPLALTLLGLSSWLLARPRLHIRPNVLPVPRLLSGPIALFGVVCAVFSCAELASAFADAGLVALLDASLMFVALAGGILGVWCAIAGTTWHGPAARTLLRSNHLSTHLCGSMPKVCFIHIQSGGSDDAPDAAKASLLSACAFARCPDMHNA